MIQRLAIFITLLVSAASMLLAQDSTLIDSPSTPAQMAGRVPTDTDMYCSGFYSRAALDRSLTVLGGEDNGLKFEFADRDLIYLNRGLGFINAPGGTYMLLRAVKDLNLGESFPGQQKLLWNMGTLYTEIARIQIDSVQKGSSTAHVLHTCEPIQGGDFAVPVGIRTPPTYKADALIDHSAPASGKSTGLIVSVKEFQETAATGQIVYLNLGKRDGLNKGSNIRVFRTYRSPSQAMVETLTKNYQTNIGPVNVGRTLTPQEIDTLPRQVVGEILILSTSEESSTGIVSHSWKALFPGDQVELE